MKARSKSAPNFIDANLSQPCCLHRVSGEAIGSPVCVSTHAFFDQTMVHVPEVSEDGRYSDWDRSRDAE